MPYKGTFHEQICHFMETDIFSSAHLNVKGQAKSTLLTKPKTELLRHRTTK